MQHQHTSVGCCPNTISNNDNVSIFCSLSWISKTNDDSYIFLVFEKGFIGVRSDKHLPLPIYTREWKGYNISAVNVEGKMKISWFWSQTQFRALHRESWNHAAASPWFLEQEGTFSWVVTTFFSRNISSP